MRKERRNSFEFSRSFPYSCFLSFSFLRKEGEGKKERKRKKKERKKE